MTLLAEVSTEVLLDLHDYDGANPWNVTARLLAGQAHWVVLTKAEEGAEVINATQRISVSPCAAELRDGNGAGDAFSVGLWNAQRQGLSLEEAGRFAAAAAAFAIEDDALFPAGVTAANIRRRAGLQKKKDPDTSPGPWLGWPWECLVRSG